MPRSAENILGASGAIIHPPFSKAPVLRTIIEHDDLLMAMI